MMHLLLVGNRDVRILKKGDVSKRADVLDICEDLGHI